MINTRGIVYLVAIDDGDARVVYIIAVCKTKPWHFLLMFCFVYICTRESWICECEMCVFFVLGVSYGSGVSPFV